MSANQERPAVTLRINGDRLTEGSGGTYDHIDPTTGLVDATIPLAGPAEIDTAVRAAHAAFDGWQSTPPAERRRLIHKLGDLIEANTEEFRRRSALDNGTPVLISAHYVKIAIEWSHYYAGWADKITGDVTSSFRSGGEISYTLAQPYGVIGMIITWNGPLVSLAMKVPAALATGNTVVVKPSELTPFAAELFADLVEEAGFPAGVVNIVPGDAAAGAALVGHELVKKVSFTGGPVTAQKILEACAAQMKPSVMELGGKSANIIFDDADLALACGAGVFNSVGAQSGQGCSIPTRMLVHRPVYEQAIAIAAEAVKHMTVGDPFDPTTISGPVINQAAADRIMGMIERAPSEGARLIAGGSRIDRPGYFIEPTIFADVDPASELAQKEVFGPVLVITPFEDEADAIRIANSTEYGLSAQIQTKDVYRALRVAEGIEAGEVLVNGAIPLTVHRPFGGVGLSGFGKEGGRQGIEEFLRVKSVAVAG